MKGLRRQSYYSTFIPIMLCMFVAIASIGVLTWKATYPMHQKNGFRRKFSNSGATPDRVIVNRAGITAVIGVSTNTIYFQTYTSGEIVVMDNKLQYVKTYSVRQHGDQPSAVSAVVDSPRIYLFNGNKHMIIAANLESPAVNNWQLPTGIFSRGISISQTSFVIRGFDTGTSRTDQLFMKSDIARNKLTIENNVSERHGDAGISTDGLLHYDTAIAALCFVYFYRNRFLCIDTNLQLAYVGHLIDTTNEYQSTAALVTTKKETISTTVKPSRIINYESCVSGGYLYNNSVLKGDNESQKNFNNNSVIDVYDLKNGLYTGSFYIPDIRGDKAETFRVFKKQLVVVYHRYIATFPFGI